MEEVACELECVCVCTNTCLYICIISYIYMYIYIYIYICIILYDFETCGGDQQEILFLEEVAGEHVFVCVYTNIINFPI